jgi:peptide/nickel transport system permease protein
VLKRILVTPLVLLGVVTILFVLTRIIPGDPARLAAGPKAGPEQVAQVRHEFGLDRPLPEQYVRYVVGLLRGDLGKSIQTNRPVTADLKLRFPATIELAVIGVLLTVLLGVPIGVISAVKAGTWPDHIGRVLALLGASVPSFWLGLTVQLLFFSKLGWLPADGRIDTMAQAPVLHTGLFLIDSLLAGNWSLWLSSLSHLVLPALTLSLGSMAITSRITRSNLVESLGQDYIRTARAKGLPERIVTYRHAFRNALIPTLTIIGLQAGALLSGTFLVEVIFDWPGIGLYTVTAITSLDYPAIMGTALLATLIYIITNLVVDLMYALVDPRVRY